MASGALYNLEYWISKRHIETLEWNKPIHICRWRALVLKDGKNYNLGSLKVKRNKIIPHN